MCDAFPGFSLSTSLRVHPGLFWLSLRESRAPGLKPTFIMCDVRRRSTSLRLAPVACHRRGPVRGAAVLRFACYRQLTTTSRGSLAVFSICSRTRNRWPSLLTTNGLPPFALDLTVGTSNSSLGLPNSKTCRQSSHPLQKSHRRSGSTTLCRRCATGAVRRPLWRPATCRAAATDSARIPARRPAVFRIATSGKRHSGHWERTDLAGVEVNVHKRHGFAVAGERQHVEMARYFGTV